MNAGFPDQMTPEERVAQRVRTRLYERHGAASIRAVAGEPAAEYRARRVLVDGRPMPFAAPYLGVEFGDVSLSETRGVSDSLALRLKHSDFKLHHSLQPEHAFAKIVFDILEQIRCESLAADSLIGVHRNLEVSFRTWSDAARDSKFVESSLGILLYTVIHMVRGRLVRNVDDEDVAALIEATRANIGPLIGIPFYQLSKCKQDQREYASHALEIASTLADLAGTEGETLSEPQNRRRQFASLPPDWEMQEVPDELGDVRPGVGGQAGTTAEMLSTAGGYGAYSREYDSEVSGHDLYRPEQRVACRQELDRLVASQAVSVSRLALRLQSLFAVAAADDWNFGQEEGYIDARRLAQLVGNHSYSQIFYQDRMQPKCDVVVSFLIDNSGSMKSQRYDAVAVLVDTFARALELAGAKSEVLGFSTSAWNGGRVMEDWRKNRAPEDPGRLNETMHITYKSADETWRQSRNSISSLLKTLHYREGVDGEAVLWAYQRLLARPESRRFLVMISDGSPMDAATDNANPDQFLLDHLKTVANHIDLRSPISLGCIGIDQDTSFFIRNSVSSNLTGTLGNRAYQVLEELFSNTL